MKLWYGYGSEHSMDLVMIGRFRTAEGAAKAAQIIKLLTEKVSAENAAGRIDFGGIGQRLSDGMRDFLNKLKIHSIGPAELEQFAYDVTVKVEGNEIVIRTDESEVSAFLKVLLDQEAKVEIYSAHHYPPADDDDGGG
jgi:hypothetical protein